MFNAFINNIKQNPTIQKYKHTWRFEIGFPCHIFKSPHHLTPIIRWHLKLIFKKINLVYAKFDLHIYTTIIGMCWIRNVLNCPLNFFWIIIPYKLQDLSFWNYWLRFFWTLPTMSVQFDSPLHKYTHLNWFLSNSIFIKNDAQCI